MLSFKLSPVSGGKHFPRRQNTKTTFQYLPWLFGETDFYKAICCFMGRRKFHPQKYFWKIKPFFLEKPVQFPFTDSLHVLPMRVDGPSLTFPFSLYLVRVCFPRGLCFECVCLVSHCLPYWLLYSFPSEFAAYLFLSCICTLLCFAQLGLASWLYEDVPLLSF